MSSQIGGGPGGAKTGSNKPGGGGPNGGNNNNNMPSHGGRQDGQSGGPGGRRGGGGGGGQDLEIESLVCPPPPSDIALNEDAISSLIVPAPQWRGDLRILLSYCVQSPPEVKNLVTEVNKSGPSGLIFCLNQKGLVFVRLGFCTLNFVK